MNKIESIHICVAGKKYNISQFLCIQIPPKYVRRLCFGARRKSVEKCTANNTPSASWSCKKKMARARLGFTPLPSSMGSNSLQDTIKAKSSRPFGSRVDAPFLAPKMGPSSNHQIQWFLSINDPPLVWQRKGLLKTRYLLVASCFTENFQVFKLWGTHGTGLLVICLDLPKKRP